MRREGAGFTLLEMLVVIGILALLVITAVSAHLGIRNAQERAARGLERGRVAETFLDRFERELNGTLLLVKDRGADRLAHPFVFVGRDRFEAEADTDAVRFVTRSPARSSQGGGDVGLRMVTYVAASDLGGELRLLREENVLPEGLQKEPEVEEGQVVLDGLVSFRLAFLDPESSEWVDGWDSTDVAQLDRLPSSVDVHVVLLEKDATGELYEGPEHARVVRLPVPPVDIAKLRGEGVGVTGEEDPNSPGETDEGNGEAEGGAVLSQCTDSATLSRAIVGVRSTMQQTQPNDRYNPRLHKGLRDYIVTTLGGSWDSSRCPP